MIGVTPVFIISSMSINQVNVLDEKSGQMPGPKPAINRNTVTRVMTARAHQHMKFETFA